MTVHQPRPLLIEHHDPISGYLGIFEDDGKTAYAYLRSTKEIVGDVWLYNHGEPPATPEWDDPSNLPFANPKEFAAARLYQPVEDRSDVRFEWIQQTDSPTLRIHLRGEFFAVLTAGSKPGWSRLAMNVGPLARPLDDAPSPHP
jgi:hypothetical protein